MKVKVTDWNLDYVSGMCKTLLQLSTYLKKIKIQTKDLNIYFITRDMDG